MKKTVLALFLSAFSLLAQAQSAPHAWNCFPDATMTVDAYWSHQPPAVQALRNLPTVGITSQSPSPRATLALQLAKQGYIIDEAIMVGNWDPICTMGERKALGYTWVPNALQPNIPVVPGVGFPGLPSYDPSAPPPGSIKVSDNIADYPPFSPPPPPPALVTKLVGQCGVFGDPGTCAVNQGAMALPDGTVVSQDGASYKLHIAVGLFGKTGWFELLKT